MGRTHAHSAIQVIVMAMLVSIFFVGEIRSAFPGTGVPSDYCTLNPHNCRFNGGQTLKRQMKKVRLPSSVQFLYCHRLWQ